MKRKFSTLLFGVLAVFAFMPVSASANCVGATQIFSCGDVVTESCTFNADMNCHTRHGLIIGASGITIDGAGFTLNGNGTAGRHCAVNVAPEDDPDRLWCVGHPCRTADVTPADDDPLTFNGCLDSGIINAKTTLGGGVDPAVPMCQGGFDDVTVKDLQITGWCDGIFMSGDCESSTAWRGTCFENPEGGFEYRLTGIIIEGNHIYANGNNACGNYTPAAGGDGGDWDVRLYNDAIFTAELGLDESNSSVWAADNGLAAEGSPLWRWHVWWKIDNSNNFTVLTKNTCPGNIGWMASYKQPMFPWWKLWTVLPPNKRSFPNRIVHNVILDQKGCSCISCAGANGINLQGGLEVGGPNGEDPVGNCGANEIGNNYIASCDMSGISYSHATKHNRIHGNFLIKNLFGGITDPCGWCHDSYIFDNRAEGNMGVNIATGAMSTIVNNECFKAQALGVNDERRELGYAGPACEGTGILVGEDSAVSVISENTSCYNSFADIVDGSGAAIGDENKCNSSMGFTPGCKYKSWNLPW